MRSTMMDVPLTVTGIMRYGTALYGGREVVTCTGDGTRRQTYATTGARAARLANALRVLRTDQKRFRKDLHIRKAGLYEIGF